LPFCSFAGAKLVSGRWILDALPIGRLTMDLAGVLKPSSFFALTSVLAALTRPT
jgi:hypothetical protein